MNILRKTRMVIGGLATALMLALSPAAQAQDFRGGGAITDFVGCESQGWFGSVPVRARFRLAATSSDGLNHLSLYMTDTSFQLAIPEPLSDTGTLRRFWGYAAYSEWATWSPRPRLRFRQVTSIGGPTPATATDLLLRLRVRGYNWMPGCEAMVVLALHRV